MPEYTQLNRELREAAIDNNIAALTVLLAQGAEIEAKDDQGYTALHWAARNGCAEALEFLLENAADPDSKSDISWTPLHLAAIEGHLYCARLLINADATIDAPDSTGLTPLQIAALNGRDGMCEYLIRKGANLEHKDDDGCTAQDHAQAASHQAVIALLQEHQSLINSQRLATTFRDVRKTPEHKKPRHIKRKQPRMRL